MPRAVCSCGATFPLSEEEAARLKGREFRCPKCAKAQPPGRVPTASAPRAPALPPLDGPGAGDAEPGSPHSRPLSRGERGKPAAAAGGAGAAPAAPQSAVVPPPLPPRLPRDRKAPILAIAGLLALLLVGVGVIAGWALFAGKNGGPPPAQDRPAVANHFADEPGIPEQAVAAAGDPAAAPPVEAADEPRDAVDENVARSMPPREIVSRVQPAVVMVINDDRKALGSGFFIERDGTFVTNFHVINGASAAKVILHDKVTRRVAGFIAVAPERDIAILQTERQDASVPVVPLADDLPQVLDPVWAFGAPLGLSDTVTPGSVNAIRSGDELRKILIGRGRGDIYTDRLGYTPDATWIQMSAPISGGNSGGPLVNDRGEVVGITTWQDRSGQNLNFAISIQHVWAMLRGSGRELKPLAALPGWRFAIPVPAGRSAGAAPSAKPPEPQAPRPKEPARKSATTAPAAAQGPESKAAARLSSAKLLIREGKKDAARKWLRQIVKDNPNTDAAREAKKLLDGL